MMISTSVRIRSGTGWSLSFTMIMDKRSSLQPATTKIKREVMIHLGKGPTATKTNPRVKRSIKDV
jgi:hypothetical protein